MVQDNRKEVSLYKEAKAGLSSLIYQTVTIFLGFVVMLLMTGGAPSSFLVALSFCSGTAFIAWSEQRRIKQLRSPTAISISKEDTSEELKSTTDAIHRVRELENRFSFVYLGVWLEDSWPNSLLTIGTIGLALSGLLASRSSPDLKWLYQTDYGIWFGVSTILSFIGGVTSWKKQMSLNELKEKNRRMEQDRQSYYEIIPDELWVLSNKVLNLGVTERVSIFRYVESSLGDDEAHGFFFLLKRQAENPRFQRPGRKIYPEYQGVLSFVLENGKFSCDNLPDPSSQNREYFDQINLRLRIPEEIAKNRTMQARSYAGFRINDFNNRLAAVIVFESLNPTGLNFQALEDLMSGQECDRLARLLERSKPFEPKPDVALKGGY